MPPRRKRAPKRRQPCRTNDDTTGTAAATGAEQNRQRFLGSDPYDELNLGKEHLDER